MKILFVLFACVLGLGGTFLGVLSVAGKEYAGGAWAGGCDDRPRTHALSIKH